MDIPLLLGKVAVEEAVSDDNIVDAILLGAKRIGNSFGLHRRPYLLEELKRRNVCVEVYPIADEVLALTSRMSGHALYGLLAKNVHCVLSTATAQFSVIPPFFCFKR